MDNRKQQIDKFFDEYCAVFDKAIRQDPSDSEIERIAALYSDSFIGANPSGVNCGKNDKHFKDTMLKGYAFYRNIGIIAMEIVSKEISILDNFHTLTKIRFKSTYIKKDETKGNIEFDNIYFIQSNENQHKVFGFITGDEQAVLREFGLIS